MSGNVEGGRQAAITSTRLHGANFYRDIGRLGGAAKVPKGFAMNRRRASEAGRLGGKNSKRVWTAEQRAKHSVAMINHYHPNLITRIKGVFHANR